MTCTAATIAIFALLVAVPALAKDDAWRTAGTTKGLGNGNVWRDYATFAPARNLLRMQGLTVGGAPEAFYKAPENRLIPIRSALGVFAMYYQGKPTDAMNQHIDALR